jgi:threonine synthase
LAYFNKDKKDSKNGSCGYSEILVHASGFLGAGVEVIILLSIRKVSDIQEKQLTTLGQNIKALEMVFFDDCQDMVKRAFLDDSLTHHNLTSANLINIALVATMFYFFLLIRN